MCATPKRRMAQETVLVVDVGSASLKAGYAGEDAPATIIPSVPQKYPHGIEVRMNYSHFILNVIFLNSILKSLKEDTMIKLNIRFEEDK
jgi:actin-related protein